MDEREVKTVHTDFLMEVFEQVVKVGSSGTVELAEGSLSIEQCTDSIGASGERVSLCDRVQQVTSLAHLLRCAYKFKNRSATQTEFNTKCRARYCQLNTEHNVHKVEFVFVFNLIILSLLLKRGYFN